jgi:hypothetical protein
MTQPKQWTAEDLMRRLDAVENTLNNLRLKIDKTTGDFQKTAKQQLPEK